MDPPRHNSHSASLGLWTHCGLLPSKVALEGMKEGDGEAAQGPECLNARQDRSVCGPAWAPPCAWMYDGEACATAADDSSQVLLNSRPGADHTPRLTSLHPLGHQISQGNKTQGVGRVWGGGEGFRAGTIADHAGGVRRRASRAPGSRDCDVQTGQVDAGGSEPVLWAVVSPPSTPSGFGSNSIPAGPRWERARAQRGHRAAAPIGVDV